MKFKEKKLESIKEENHQPTNTTNCELGKTLIMRRKKRQEKTHESFSFRKPLEIVKLIRPRKMIMRQERRLKEE